MHIQFTFNNILLLLAFAAFCVYILYWTVSALVAGCRRWQKRKRERGCEVTTARHQEQSPQGQQEGALAQSMAQMNDASVLEALLSGGPEEESFVQAFNKKRDGERRKEVSEKCERLALAEQQHPLPTGLVCPICGCAVVVRQSKYINGKSFSYELSFGCENSISIKFNGNDHSVHNDHPQCCFSSDTTSRDCVLRKLRIMLRALRATGDDKQSACYDLSRSSEHIFNVLGKNSYGSSDLEAISDGLFPSSRKDS
jgi:hypothetical protein